MPIYLSKEFLESNISDLLKYLMASNLSPALSEVTKLCAFLLAIPVTSMSVKKPFSALRKVHTYLRRTQTQQRFTPLSLLTDELNVLQDSDNSLCFCDYVIGIFTDKKLLLGTGIYRH